jgi:choline kinase
LPFHSPTSSFQSSAATEKFGSTSTLGQPVSETEDFKSEESQTHHPSHSHHTNIVAQVADWLKHEKAKKILRGTRKRNAPSKTDGVTNVTENVPQSAENDSLLHIGGHTQTPSEMSDEGVDLDQLEKILSRIEMGDDSLSTPKNSKRDLYFPHQLSRSKIVRKISVGASSDRELADSEALVPSAEVVLDNSKTLAYSSSAAGSAVSLPESRKRAVKEREAWLHFKNEIVRLAHTLKLKGWRQVPLDRGGEIDVQRLSGALTNAVYVVSPPNHLSQTMFSSHSGTAPSTPRKSVSPS